MTITSQLEAQFDLKLKSLGLEIDEHDRGRLWRSYLRQVELSAAWSKRLHPAVEPALEFRAVGLVR